MSMELTLSSGRARLLRSVAAFAIVVSGLVVASPNSVSQADDVIGDVGTMVPARLLDTRSNGETVDDRFEAAGKVTAGSPIMVQIAGRGNVPVDAVDVELNITSIQNKGRRFATLDPCTATPPTASTLNYTPGVNITNAANIALNTSGEVCVFTSSTSHYALDVVAYTTPVQTAADPPLLDGLTIARQNTNVPYDRDEWPHWIDADGDCKDTRAEVLIRDSSSTVTFNTSGCRVDTGQWLDPWTGLQFTLASDVDIDHTVPLANAHRSGGWAWTTATRTDFANDLDNSIALRAMDDGSNSSKSDSGPDEWKPPLTTAWCSYATDWAAIKIKWNLTVTQAEYNELDTMLSTCESPPTDAPATVTEIDGPVNATEPAKRIHIEVPPTDPPPSNCDPSYPTVCIPPPPPDLNCSDIPHRDFLVLQPDPHRFDGNKDGVGCTS